MDNPFELLIQEFRELKAIVLSNHTNVKVSEPVYLKIDAAASYLSTTENALRVMVHKQQLPFIKKQGKLYFRQRDLVNWMESGTIVNDEIDPTEVLSMKNKKLRLLS